MAENRLTPSGLGFMEMMEEVGFLKRLPPEAAGLRLARITRKDELRLCERVVFRDGRAAVDTVLRRAAISGRVEVGGEISNHFADIIDENGDMIETVALDARSYGALKTKWMRCRVETADLGRAVASLLLEREGR